MRSFYSCWGLFYSRWRLVLFMLCVGFIHIEGLFYSPAVQTISVTVIMCWHLGWYCRRWQKYSFKNMYWSALCLRKVAKWILKIFSILTIYWTALTVLHVTFLFFEIMNSDLEKKNGLMLIRPFPGSFRFWGVPGYTPLPMCLWDYLTFSQPLAGFQNTSR